MTFDPEEIEDRYIMRVNALVVMGGRTDLAYRPWYFANALREYNELIAERNG